MRVDGFDWDRGNRAKCEKHGVSIPEIEDLFARGPRIAPDPGHSLNEQRLIAVGRGRTGQPLFVAFTMRRARCRWLVRPISARYMHAKEMARYDQESPPDDDR